jgi:hypothetical protein
LDRVRLRAIRTAMTRWLQNCRKDTSNSNSASALRLFCRAPGNRLGWHGPLTAVAVTWAIIATAFALNHGTSRPVSERYDNPDVITLWRGFSIAGGLLSFRWAPLVRENFRRLVPKSDHKRHEHVRKIRGFEAARSTLTWDRRAAYTYTGVGEATAALELARLFVAQQHDLDLVLSSRLTWEDVARNELIFVGPPKYNLQEADLPVKQDFRITHGHLENSGSRRTELVIRGPV